MKGILLGRNISWSNFCQWLRFLLKLIPNFETMMRTLFISFMMSCGISSVYAQELNIVNYEELENILAASPGKAKLVNFWATWCKPCVEELPYFNALQKEADDKSPEFIFVSLDFMSQTPKVKDLIKRLSLNGTQLQLNQPGGEWIDQFDSNWSGAIPYTILLLPGGEKIEHYDAFDSVEELKSFLNKNIVN